MADDTKSLSELVEYFKTMQRNAEPGSFTAGLIAAMVEEAEVACMDPYLFMAKITIEYQNRIRAKSWLASRAVKSA